MRSGSVVAARALAQADCPDAERLGCSPVVLADFEAASDDSRSDELPDDSHSVDLLVDSRSDELPGDSHSAELLDDSR